MEAQTDMSPPNQTRAAQTSAIAHTVVNVPDNQFRRINAQATGV